MPQVKSIQKCGSCIVAAEKAKGIPGKRDINDESKHLERNPNLIKIRIRKTKRNEGKKNKKHRIEGNDLFINIVMCMTGNLGCLKKVKLRRRLPNLNLCFSLGTPRRGHINLMAKIQNHQEVLRDPINR
ncbi:hypothetical protein CJ030_MR8G023201 [Morella rubra]|uniref:Uncharacterized protein n=1 Tax=Morella rubra TaxID=262757 RepID=A0A6A1UT07_9ROSI|nr:hypothetical protein CJ030_MR8G023201 [Morella rubra]